MGQSADEVRRAAQARLQQGETAVIRPGTLPTNGDAGAGSDDPGAMEAGIEQTRAEMSETIDAIQQRLSPENLKEEAKEHASELAEHAKEAAREAVQHAVHEVKMALRDARDGVRDATIGRVEQMARTMNDSTDDARSGIVATIKHNPFPAALAGIGLAWLFMNRQSAPRRPERRSYLSDQGYGEYRDRDGDRYDQSRYFRVERDRDGTTYGTYSSPSSYSQGQGTGGGMIERAQDKVGQATGQVGDMAGRAGDAIGQAASATGDTVGRMAGQVGDMAGRAGGAIGQAAGQVGETAGSMASQAQHQMQRAEDRVGRALQDNPLAVGAVALALGTAVGLAVPQTRREHELFGQARDNLVERAQDLAQETMGKVQDVVAETGQTVQREAQAQGLVGR